MKNKIILFAMVMISSISYAIWKNSTMDEISFDDVYQQIQDIGLGNPLDSFSDNMVNTMQYDNQSDELSELYKNSDVVAVVKPMERVQRSSVVNTKVQVIKYMKTDNPSEQNIHIFEQFHLQYLDKEGQIYANLFSDAGYVPMDMGKEYLVFLKKSKEYKGNQYGFLSLLYGKMPYLHDEPIVKELVSFSYGTDTYPIKELSGADVILFHIVEDKDNPSDDDTKDRMRKYDQYKDHYLQLLHELMTNSYKINGV